MSIEEMSTKSISENMCFEASRGCVPGFTPILKFAESNNNTTTLKTLWPGEGFYVYPTIATKMKISSSSNDDINGGIGAWIVNIFGLDGNYDWIYESIILNGQTPVETQQKFLRINIFYIYTAGSTHRNIGIIYAGTGNVVLGKPGNVYGIIDNVSNDLDNISMQSPFTIPAGYNGLIKGLLACTGALKESKMGLYARFYNASNNGVFVSYGKINLYESPVHIPLEACFCFPEKTDLEIRCKLKIAGTVNLTGGYVMILERKDQSKKFILPNSLISSKNWN